MWRNVVITGFMGTGKTTVGRIVANLLDRPFFDTDEVIARRTGLAVPDIFAHRGETHFRERETEALNMLTRTGGKVIATGGGSLLDAENVSLVEAAGIIFCLEARPDIIEQRLRGCTSRPLLSGNDLGLQLRRLLAQREAAYRRLPNHLDTSGCDPQQVATRVIGRYMSAGLRKRSA